MPEDRTTIQVSVELWRWLNGRKRPGESFDDVLRSELDIETAASVDGGTVDRRADAGPGGPPANRRPGDLAWYRCGYCGKVFEVPGALAAHVEDTHSEATINAGLDVDHDVIVSDANDAYRCPDCDRSFDGWGEFAAHNEQEHGRGNGG